MTAAHYPATLSQQITAAFDAAELRCRVASAAYAARSPTTPNGPWTLVVGGRPPSAEPVTVYQSATLPGVSYAGLASYLQRYTQCSDECLLVGLVLVNRYATATGMEPTVHMMHRIYVAAFQTGMKANFEVFISNHDCSRVAGMSNREMNILEADFCVSVTWKLIVRAGDIVHLLTSGQPFAKDTAEDSTDELAAIEREAPLPPALIVESLSSSGGYFVLPFVEPSDLTPVGAHTACASSAEWIEYRGCPRSQDIPQATP